MIKQLHTSSFGPGSNHIHFMRTTGANKDADDEDDEEEEEGLDEREPEKAICPDNQKLLFKALMDSSNSQLDFK